MILGVLFVIGFFLIVALVGYVAVRISSDILDKD